MSPALQFPAETVALFREDGIIPLPIARRRVHRVALQAWCDWNHGARQHGWTPDERAPWLPVGLCGPLVVAGHHAPRDAGPPPVPPPFSVRALLEKSTYDQIRERVTERLAELTPGAALAFALFDREPHPAAPARDLARLLAALPGPDDERHNVATRADHETFDESLLPPGWKEALWQLRGHARVCDARMLEPQPEALSLLSQGLLRSGVLPFAVFGPDIFAVAPCAEESEEAEALQKQWRSKRPDPRLQLHLVTDAGVRIADALKAVRGRLAAQASAQLRFTTVPRAQRPIRLRWKADELRGLDPVGPSPLSAEQLFAWSLSRALDLNGSDLHYQIDDNLGRIRLRVDGIMVDQYVTTPAALAAIVTMVKNSAGMASDNITPKDGNLQVSVDGAFFDLRLSTVPDVYDAASLVIRIQRRDVERWRLDALQLAPDVLTALRAVIARPHGIVLVSGPTGSGKTTTLAAILQDLNQPDTKILSVEDPVEYRIPGVVQVPVSAPHVTFASAVRAFMRQDPDTILIGEIRDLETGTVATAAAKTGHLVLATVHANSALKTLARMTDLGVPPYDLAVSLAALQAQRLVRLVCQQCCLEVPPEPALRELFARHGLATPRRVMGANRAGCPECIHGYRGRKPVMEIIVVDDALAGLIARLGAPGGAAVSLEQIAQHLGARGSFIPMFVHGLRMVAAGETTFPALLECVSD